MELIISCQFVFFLFLTPVTKEFFIRGLNASFITRITSLVIVPSWLERQTINHCLLSSHCDLTCHLTLSCWKCFSPPPAFSIPSSRSLSEVTFKYIYLQVFIDSRVILYLLTRAFASCSYSQPSWLLCPATLGWCSGILISFCRVLHNVHISLKNFFSLHNNLTMLSHFTDEVIEVHRSSISRIMLLLKGAAGVKTRTSDSKSVLFLTHQLPLGLLFFPVIFAVQTFHPSL